MRRMIRLMVLATVVGLALSGGARVPAASAATMLVKPGRLDHFVLTAPATALAGESFLVRVEPYDANDNLITEFRGKGGVFQVNVAPAGEAVPAKFRGEEFAGGATVKVASKKAGPLTISVTEGDGTTPLASAQVRILPNRLDRFALSAPREAVAGELFQVRVVAQDAFGNTKDDLADIRETLRADVVGAGSAQSADKALPPFRGGEATLSFMPRKAGSIKVVVVETRTRAGGESAPLQVGPAALDHFTVLGPKTAAAGEKFTVVVAAYDAFENPVTGYQSRGDGVALRASGAGELTPATVPAKEFRDGQARVTATYTRAEKIRVIARELNREAAGESEAFVVTPADPENFRVTTPAEAVAGEAFPLQIEAFDRFGNLVEDYDLRGLEVHLSTDGRGQLTPAAVGPGAFVRGKATVNASYNRAESFTVLAALSRESLEKVVADRKRQAAAAPAPAVSPEEAARERERAAAAKAREEAERAREEAGRKRAKPEAAASREEPAERPALPPPPPPPPVATPAPAAEPAPLQAAPAPAPPASTDEGLRLARSTAKVLDKVAVEEAADQLVIRLGTTGAVSYSASTGSRDSKEWIWLDLYPAVLDPAVGRSVPVSSSLLGGISLEQLEPEKVRVSLHVLVGISYVVTQQDRSVVVKILKTE